MSNPNDKKVLNAILNPNTPFDDLDDSSKQDEAKSKYVIDNAINEAKELEAKGVKEAERNNFDGSIEYFSAAIEKAPNWASSYNNRAQAHRLKSNMKGDELTSLEELSESHRKQRKDLQAKIQSLKKSVTKGDKKRKKEIDTEVEKLEKEFEEKCKLEIKQLESKSKTVGGVSETAVSECETKPSGCESSKMSKAQKRREKKDKSEADREQEIAKQAIENEKGPAAVELKKIKDKLSKKDLIVKEVKSDGNCMYYAISDQLDRKLSMIKSCEQLREACSRYMLAHQDDFIPYLEDVDFDVGKYRDYCERIRDPTNWGGQLELKALSDALGVVIEVVQAEGSELLIGAVDDQSNAEKRIVITYHRHMYGAGEHYNSTEPKRLVNEDE